MFRSDRVNLRKDFIRAATRFAGSIRCVLRGVDGVIYHPLPILMLAVFLTFEPSSAHSEALTASASSKQLPTGPIFTAGRHAEILDKIDLILLHRISRGQLQSTILTREDLQTTKSLDIDGYISGIMAFCKEEMTIYAADQKMQRIRKNRDGSLFLQYYGKITPDELILANAGSTYDVRHPARSKTDRFGARLVACGYSLFPLIRGDSVSSNNRFLLSFEWGDQSFQIPIRQSGFCSLDTPCVSPQHPEGFTFRYIGNRLEHLTQQSPNLEDRIHALMKGAGSVEKAFDAQLINQVNILDYEGIRNAVVSEEKEGIWIYIRTLLEESFTELETIAEHEVLHEYVKWKQLTKDTGLRQLFADLKGYAPLSSERFFLMMGSDAIQGSFTQESAQPLFFAFIDEKNFLEGGKGGHSHKNVAEFCTSFLHSIMFLDRLEQNLNRPVKLSADAAHIHHLSWQEKTTLLDNYLRALEVLVHSVSKRGVVPEILLESLEKVQRLKNAGPHPRV